MAVRNGERHLVEGVASVMAQTEPDWELIVVDDASDDGTPDLLADRAAADRRIRLLRLPHRAGPAAAYDRALTEARAPYVATLDHDDVALPDRLAEQASFLDHEPACGAVGCAIEHVDEDGRALAGASSSGRGRGRDRGRGHATTPATVRWVLPFHTPVLRSGLMARRSVLTGIGGFATTRPYADDYELCARLAEAAPLANLHTPLVRYRRHARQVSRTAWRAQRGAVLLLQQLLVFQRLGRLVPLEPLGTILLARGGTPPADVDAAADASDLCERLYTAFTATECLDDADRAWIEADHHRRLGGLTPRAAAPPGPPGAR